MTSVTLSPTINHTANFLQACPLTKIRLGFIRLSLNLAREEA